MLNLEQSTASLSVSHVKFFSRINKIELNFNVSSVLFSKYKLLFARLIYETSKDFYQDEDDDQEVDTSEDEENDDGVSVSRFILDSEINLKHKRKKLRSNSHLPICLQGRNHDDDDDYDSNDDVRSNSNNDRKKVITSRDLFKFGWTLFIYIRGIMHLKVVVVVGNIGYKKC